MDFRVYCRRLTHLNPPTRYVANWFTTWPLTPSGRDRACPGESLRPGEYVWNTYHHFSEHTDPGRINLCSSNASVQLIVWVKFSVCSSQILSSLDLLLIPVPLLVEKRVVGLTFAASYWSDQHRDMYMAAYTEIPNDLSLWDPSFLTHFLISFCAYVA